MTRSMNLGGNVTPVQVEKAVVVGYVFMKVLVKLVLMVRSAVVVDVQVVMRGITPTALVKAVVRGVAAGSTLHQGGVHVHNAPLENGIMRTINHLVEPVNLVVLASTNLGAVVIIMKRHVRIAPLDNMGQAVVLPVPQDNTNPIRRNQVVKIVPQDNPKAVVEKQVVLTVKQDNTNPTVAVVFVTVVLRDNTLAVVDKQVVLTVLWDNTNLPINKQVVLYVPQENTKAVMAKQVVLSVQ